MTSRAPQSPHLGARPRRHVTSAHETRTSALLLSRHGIAAVAGVFAARYRASAGSAPGPPRSQPLRAQPPWPPRVLRHRTGLRDLAREYMAQRLVSQTADTAENAPKLERAFIDALVRHHEAGEGGKSSSRRTLGCIAAFVRRAMDDKICRAPVAPQLMSASPYADALLALPRVVELATYQVAERCYFGLGQIGGEPALDGSVGNHTHTLDEVGNEVADTLGDTLRRRR